MKMNMIFLTFFLFCAYCSVTRTVSGQSCMNKTAISGVISDWNTGDYSPGCWFIEVSPETAVRMELKELNFTGTSCSSVYLKISIKGTQEPYLLCDNGTNPKQIMAFNDVNITYFHARNYKHKSSFRLQFTTVRGILAIKELDISRLNAINWLKNQRTKSLEWGKNTHRAIIALYLSKGTEFRGDNLQEEYTIKQMELQTSLALLREGLDRISISELSMFVNALAVTCHNPRRFYGHNLLQILSDRLASVKSPVPSAYLTLCSLNWTLSHSDVMSLVNLHNKYSNYLFHEDVRAFTVMALTCVKHKYKNFEGVPNAKNLYELAIKNFSTQLPDGSFGNVYTTASVVQALIASGQEGNKQWNLKEAVRYLMKQLNSPTIDFLSVYLTLPILSVRTLLDIKDVDCSNRTRNHGKEDEVSDVTDKIGKKMQVQYSLYIGDEKDVIFTIYLRVPVHCSAYDVMRVAQVVEPKYKFLHRDVDGQIYIYGLSGLINDPEAEKFWLLYTGDHFVNGTAKHHNESPDKVILKSNDHLIMWYRTALNYS